MKIIISIVTFCLLTVPSFSQEDVLTAFSKSLVFETKSEFVQAIASLKEVYDPKSYEMNLRLGWLHYEATQYVESLGYYQKALVLKPYSIEAKLGYVYPASALGNWNAVIDQYKKILEIDPQNSTANYRLGYIEYANKRYSNAYKYFEKIVNLYPFGYDGLLMFAWTNFQLGKSREAKVLFQKVLMYSPTDASALEGLGLIK